MNSAIEEKDPISQHVKTGTYGSFIANKEEFLIDATSLQEVVNYPPSVTPMPLAPDYLVGIFNLREMIIPIVSVKKILKLKSKDESAEPKIAIIRHQGIRVGLLFDRTGDVIRLKEEDAKKFGYHEGSQNDIVKGALSMEDGNRILQFIDIGSVIRIKNIPQVLELEKLNSERSVKTSFSESENKKCISFTVHDVRLALDINEINEIINMPEIKQSALESNLCAGIANLRGKVFPVIDFSLLLGIKSKREKNITDSDPRKVIVTIINEELIGIIVDQVESIDAYSDKDIMSFPVFSSSRTKMFTGCIKTQKLGDTFLLNHNQLFSKKEIEEITDRHNQIYQSEEDDAEKIKINASEKRTYISFYLDHLLGISIDEIKEIIAFPKDLLHAPGLPKYSLGLINLRDSLVTIIDTRLFYKLKANDDIESDVKKVLIIEKNDELFGLVVDSIDSILNVYEEGKLKLPDLLTREIEKEFGQDVKEIIKVDGIDDKVASLVVLNTGPLMDRIQAGR